MAPKTSKQAGVDPSAEGYRQMSLKDSHARELEQQKAEAEKTNSGWPSDDQYMKAITDQAHKSTHAKYTPTGDGPKNDVPSFKKGGKVKKTGLARLHKGERVIPKSKVKRVEKAMRKGVSRKG